jgi:hypothetical protein
MQAALQYTTKENRLHVWLLVSNISLAPPEQPACWQQRSVNYSTQLYSEDVSNSTEGPRLLQQVMLPGAAWSAANPAAVPRKLQASDASNATASAAPPLAPRRILHALLFNFIRDAFVLPDTAADQFFHVQNATSQLPQRPNARAAADLRAGPVPADVWTVMLWSVKRWELTSEKAAASVS